jgi:hypothetical protein
MPSRLKSDWISLEEYLDLLSHEKLTGITGYHKAEWLDVTSSAFNCEIRCVKTSLNGETLSITPFMFKQKGPIKLIGSALRGTYTEFAGPLFVSNLDVSEASKVIESQHELVSKDSYYIEWRVQGLAGQDHLFCKSLKKFGYKFDHVPSLLIDLSQDEGDLWASFVGRARTSVRKAKKAGLSATVVDPSEEWIQEYYEILTNTFSRQGLAVPHPLIFFQKIAKLSKLGLIRCVEVRIDNSIGAAAIFVQDNSRMMYLSGVATKEGMRLSASSLVQWHAMKQGISDGITDYDMGGLGIESIDKFKRSFGGTDVSHVKWVYRSKVFKLIEPLTIWLLKKGKISYS